MVGKYRRYERNRIETNIENFMSWGLEMNGMERACQLLVAFGDLLVETFEPLTDLMKNGLG